MTDVCRSCCAPAEPPWFACLGKVLREKYGIPDPGNAHRAEPDVLVNCKVLEHMLAGTPAGGLPLDQVGGAVAAAQAGAAGGARRWVGWGPVSRLSVAYVHGRRPHS